VSERTHKTPAVGHAPAGPAGEPCDPVPPVPGQGDRSPSLPLLEAAAKGSPDVPVAAQASSALPAAGNKQPGPAVGGEPAAGLGANPVADAMSENELQEHIRRILADLPGVVLWYHTFDSRRSSSGFPDLVCVGPGGVLFRELKREGKKPTTAQAQWLTALVKAGQDACVWWPHDLLSGLIARRLAKIAGLGGAP
jgi:hypothetical protein